ncbi:hypothetical protein QQF64_033489 [Cirrhinus molitorella]|uniref:Uncharacterized protein n=1 Tax=Cirrhinus molitorella TaxID=172907 RepID=A0ABR3MU22_9TELE
MSQQTSIPIHHPVRRDQLNPNSTLMESKDPEQLVVEGERRRAAFGEYLPPILRARWVLIIGNKARDTMKPI